MPNYFDRFDSPATQAQPKKKKDNNYFDQFDQDEGQSAQPLVQIPEAEGKDRSYLGASLEAGGRNVLAAGARLIDEFNPYTITESDAALLWKDDPEGLEKFRQESAAGAISRFARGQTQKAQEVMQQVSPEEKGAISGKPLSELEYFTTDPEKAAYLSPTKVSGDILNSLPTTIALAVTGYLTRGRGLQAQAKAESEALARGLSVEQARQIGQKAAVKQAGETAAKVGAVTEGAAGYAMQREQDFAEFMSMDNETLEKSPRYQALINSGYDPKAAKLKMAADAAQESGLAAGVVNALANATIGKKLGEAIGEGGNLIKRTGKGVASEAGVEAVQSTGEQFVSNLAAQGLDPEQKLSEGLGEALASGVVVGGATGGGVSAVFGSRISDKEIAKEQERQNAQEVAKAEAAEAALAETQKGLPKEPVMQAELMKTPADTAPTARLDEMQPQQTRQEPTLGQTVPVNDRTGMVEPTIQPPQEPVAQQPAAPEQQVQQAPQQQPAPIPPAQPQVSADPEQRLAELEVTAAERPLTDGERNEAEMLMAKLQDADLQAEQEAIAQDQALIDAQNAQRQEAQAPVEPTQPMQAEPTVQQAQQVAQPEQTQATQPAQGVNPNLQNRDRSRLSSVQQMQEMARNPDFLRLSQSRTPDSGAPMAFAVGDDPLNVAPQNMGLRDIAVMSDGQQVPFQYAVIESNDIEPSNFADGRENPNFNSDAVGTIKALNNGRTAGIRAAYEQGTAEEYRNNLINEAPNLGLDQAEIAAMDSPMLVRLYSDSDNRANMAARSQAQGLGMSVTEQAKQDAPLMDTQVLDLYQGGDFGNVSNTPFVSAFLARLAQTGQDVSQMMTPEGFLSTEGRNRLRAAMTQAAYDDSALVQDLFESLDTDVKAIGDALMTVAGEWANMRDAAKSGRINPQVDVTESLMTALRLVKQSRREKKAMADLMAQPDLMTGEVPSDIVQGLVRVFYSGQYMTRASSKEQVIKQLRDYVQMAKATSATPDMFGEQVSPDQIVERVTGVQDANITDQPSSGSLAGFNPAEERQGEQRPVEDKRGGEPDAVSQPKPEQQPVKQKKAKAGKAAPEPREMGQGGRPADGKPIQSGDTFKTLSGRTTTPYPKDRGKSVRQSNQWLIDNALAEAQARNDDYNATMFSGEKVSKSGTLPPASVDAMLMYLFEQQPDVVPSTIKPLVGKAEQESAAKEPKAKPKKQTDKQMLTEAIKNAKNLANEGKFSESIEALEQAKNKLWGTSLTEDQKQQLSTAIYNAGETVRDIERKSKKRAEEKAQKEKEEKAAAEPEKSEIDSDTSYLSDSTKAIERLNKLFDDGYADYEKVRMALDSNDMDAVISQIQFSELNGEQIKTRLTIMRMTNGLASTRRPTKSDYKKIETAISQSGFPLAHQITLKDRLDERYNEIQKTISQASAYMANRDAAIEELTRLENVTIDSSSAAFLKQNATLKEIIDAIQYSELDSKKKELRKEIGRRIANVHQEQMDSGNYQAKFNAAKAAIEQAGFPIEHEDYLLSLLNEPALQAKPLPEGIESAAPKSEPPPETKEPKAKPKVGENVYFTEDAAEAARAKIKASLGRLNSGVDPEIMIAGVTLAGYHIEKGARTFAAYAKAMIDDLGEDVKPYLKSWYLGVKYDPRAASFESDMDTAASVDAVNVNDLVASQEKADAIPRDSVPQRTEGQAQDKEPVAPRDSKQVDAGMAQTDKETDSKRDVSQGAGQPREEGARDTGERSEPSPSPTRDNEIARPDAIPSDKFVIDEDEIGVGGLKTKFKDNLNAIKLLKQIEAREGSPKPTAEERRVFAKYVGFGALKGVFDPDNKTWAKEHKELKELLNESEYKAAKRSQLNAHFTSPDVVQGMNAALKKLGFNGGRVLEPSMGVGNFFGLMPSSMRANSELFGVELDSLTSRLAAMIYPEANVAKETGFQEYNVPSDFFDLVQGNPPFGSEKIVDADPEAKYPSASIHNFFIMKAIDKVREGGLVQVVVSRYFMDSTDKTTREWIAERADLVSAVRLPRTAFKQNAGTEVVTDILIFRKRKSGEDKKENLDWVFTNSVFMKKDEEKISFHQNRYFINNKYNVLGKHALSGSMYSGNEYTVEPLKGRTIKDLLKEWADSLPSGVFTPIKREKVNLVDAAVPDGVKVGSFFVAEDGSIMVREPDLIGVKKSSVWTPPNAKAPERMKGMIQLRETLRKQMRLELSTDSTTKQIEDNRKKLNKQYDSFLNKFGFLNSPTNRNLFLDDTDSPLVQSLEFDYDKGIGKASAEKEGMEPKPPSATKADIFQTRVAYPPEDNIRVSSAQDALIASLNYQGKVDADFMADAYGKPVDAVLKELGDAVFNLPEGGFVTADEYLSGDVKTKLEEAKAAAIDNPSFNRHVSALEKVIPEDKKPSEISVNFGATFVPAKYYEQFAFEVTGAKAEIQFIKGTGHWIVEFADGQDSVKNTTQYGTSRMSAKKLVQMAFARQAPVVRDNLGTAREPNFVVNEVETAAAREKLKKIKDEWSGWALKDPERADDIVTTFNEKMNRIRVRAYDGAHLTLPGINPAITLLDHQKNGIWRGLQSRQILLDHVVGAGKTFQMVGLAMEMRRLGIAKKPLFVVPNHLTTQWRSDFAKLYPSSKVLAATPDDFTLNKKEKLFSKMITGDWDAVIIGHSSLSRIGLPKQTEQQVLEEQLNDLLVVIEEIKRSKGHRNVPKDMVKIAEGLKTKLEKKSKKDKKETKVVTFDELGVDALFVDEMHEFKNLMYYTQMQRVAGMGNPAGSNKAFDLFVKTRWLFNTFGKKVPYVAATGTPVSNSIVEMFNMQRYLQYPTLKENGLHTFDGWSRNFGNEETVYEVNPSGSGYRISNRFSQFNNLPSLMGLYQSFADVVTLDDLKAQELRKNPEKPFPVPKIEGGKPTNIVADRSPDVERFMGVPKASITEDGDVVFENSDPIDQIEIERNSEGFWVAKSKTKTIGERFETEEDARLAVVSAMTKPMIRTDSTSIVGMFDRLAELTKSTKGKVNALSLTNLANKAALDFRLINPQAQDFPNSKINLAVKKAKEIYDKWDGDKGTQLIFLDQSVPLSAQKAAAAKEKSAYVRDENGQLKKISATLHQLEGVEGYAVFLRKKKKGDVVSFDVFDAETGMPILADAKNKKDALTEASSIIQNDTDNFAVKRDGFSLIQESEINEFNETNNVDVENLKYFSTDDVSNIATSGPFSVYDDMKQKLIDLGVPEREIAFIHDYDTPAAKSKLFSRVNSGEVRFMFGSTPKMGAGTNVQARLVALHHIDAPWRPSDLEQREGRIIRQKNQLYMRDPKNFEVFIGRYATSQTYDTRRWQILEHKARGIEQLRKFDGVTTEIADIDGEAANSADMKAAASGDPLILEETKKRNDVKQLEKLQIAHSDNKLTIKRKIDQAERFLNVELPNAIENYDKVIDTAEKNPVKGDSDLPNLILDGKSFKEDKEYTEALAKSVAAIRTGLRTSVRLKYRGIEFNLEAQTDNKGQALMNGPISLVTYNEGLHTYPANQSVSPSGLLARFRNYIDRASQRKETAIAEGEKRKQTIEQLKQELDKEFPQKAELEKSRADLSKVQKMLMAKGPQVPDNQKEKVNKAIADRMKQLKQNGFAQAVEEIEAIEQANKDAAAFSLGINTGQGMTKAEVEEIAKQFTDGFANAPVVNVLGSFTESMGAPKELAEAQAEGGAQGAPMAFYFRGQVFLIADQLNDRKEVIDAIAHEMLGHHGLRGLFGDSLNKVLDNLIAARPELVKAKAKQYGLSMKNTNQKRMAAEEVLAEMAQAQPELGFVRKAVAAVSTWLRSNVGLFKNLTLTDSEIIRDYIAPARDFVKRQRKASEIDLIASTGLAMQRQVDGPTQDSPAMFSRSVTDPTTRLGKWKAKIEEVRRIGIYDTLLYELQDKFVDLKRLTQHIGKVSELADAYTGEELFHKRVAYRHKKFLTDELKPLMAAMRLRGINLPDFEDFLHARHAKEANRRLAKMNLNESQIEAKLQEAEDELKTLRSALQKHTAKGMATKDIESAIKLARQKVNKWKNAEPFAKTEEKRLSLSGMTDARADEILNSMDKAKRENMAELEVMVRQMQDKTLDTLVDYGLESRTMINTWQNTYSNYVPLFRDAEAEGINDTSHPVGSGFSVKGSASRRRVGSNREVTNILAHIAMQREAAITRGEKNKVAKQLYIMAKQNPDKSVWQTDKPPKIRKVDPATGLVKSVVDPFFREQKNVIMVRLGGVDRALIFNSKNPKWKRLSESLKNLDASDIALANKIAAYYTRFISAINTQYNVVFGMINLLRDTQTAALNLTTTPIGNRKMQVAKGVAPALWAIMGEERGWKERGGDNQKWRDLWNDLQSQGGTTGFRDLFRDPSERTKQLNALLNAAESGNVKKSWEATMQWLTDYNEAMENANRLSAYAAALDAGMSKQKAASLAKNLTVNFNRKGRYGNAIGSWWAFFNAALQGTGRMVHTLAGPAGKAIMFGGVGLGFLTSMAAMALMGGSEEEESESEYDKIPDFVKEKALILPISRKDYIALPMPLGFNLFPNLGRMAAEALMSKKPKTNAERIGEALLVTADSFNPLGSSNDLWSMIAPTPVDLPLELLRNRDWTGRTIYNEDFSSQRPTTGLDKARSGASPASRFIADMINKGTGGTDYVRGEYSPTPDAIDYLFESLTGGVGRELNKLSKTIASVFTGDELPPYQIPLFGRLYGNTRTSSSVSPIFYETVLHMNMLEQEVKGRAEDGKPYDDFIKQNPEINLLSMSKSANKQVKEINKFVRKLREEKPDGYQATVKEMNERKTKIMNKLVYAVNKNRERN